MDSCSRNPDHRSRLSRAQGCPLGAEDALGSLFEFQSPEDIHRGSGHFDKKQDGAGCPAHF